MKNNTLTIFAFFGLLTFSSCDFVTIPEQGAVGATGSTGTTVQKKVLLEDYTGHKCVNCPGAAVIATSILDANPDRVVVMSVHAGFQATPNTTGTQYLTNFQTTAGTAYDNYFGISNNWGNPNGLVDRTQFSSSSSNPVQTPSNWAGYVSSELAKPALAKIEITNTYNPATRQLSCNVVSTFLYDTLTGGPYKIIALITQDSIVSDQDDVNLGYIPNYIDRHVLRDNLNGTWGDTLFSGVITANAPISKTYNYTFPTTYPAAGGPSSTPCDVSKCHIIAFIYNDAINALGTKEVIQVEEKKVQ